MIGGLNLEYGNLKNSNFENGNLESQKRFFGIQYQNPVLSNYSISYNMPPPPLHSPLKPHHHPQGVLGVPGFF